MQFLNIYKYGIMGQEKRVYDSKTRKKLKKSL